MDEFHGSAGALPGPEDHAAPAPLDAGRLGGFLCQLQRKRFDGVLHISTAGQSAAIGFRDGTPVTFDDPTPGHTLAEQMIERGQLTRAQCNSVLASMTDDLVEDEAVAFFEHAVQLGFLTDEDAKVELSSRIRARMIQLFAWRGCETTLEPGRAALLDRRELPQSLGAILYMGVRTFYEEEFLASVHPDPAHTFVKLSAAASSIAHHFGLDDEELQLLLRLHPEQSLSQLFSDPRVDRVQVLGLVLSMRMSQLCEVASTPFARQPMPRAKQRNGDPRNDARETAPDPNALRNRTGSYAGPLPESEPKPLRGKTGSHVGPLPESPAPNALRNKTGSYAGPLPESEPNPLRGKTGSHVGPLPEPLAPPPRSKMASTVGPLPEPFGAAPLRTHTGSAIGPLPEAPHTARGKAGSSVGPLPDPPAPRPSTKAAKPGTDATQEALLEAAARTARMRRSVPARRNARPADPLPNPAADGGKRPGPANPAATSGGRSPSEPAAASAASHRQAHSSGGRSPSEVSGTAANSQQQSTEKANQPAAPDQRGDYAKAHLQELIARHKQAANAPESSAPAARDLAREMREARSLLHSQHYSRAEKILAALVEIEPQNEIFRTYHLWARWRAQPDAAEPFLEELQELGKKLLAHNEHAAFAAYALGHVFFHSKRDDLAEKFFKRAHTVDRTNKDAERHLLILERRKQAAAEGGAGANRKLFGIQLPNSKPKP